MFVLVLVQVSFIHSLGQWVLCQVSCLNELRSDFARTSNSTKLLWCRLGQRRQGAGLVLNVAWNFFNTGWNLMLTFIQYSVQLINNSNYKQRRMKSTVSKLYIHRKSAHPLFPVTLLECIIKCLTSSSFHDTSNWKERGSIVTKKIILTEF